MAFKNLSSFITILLISLHSFGQQTIRGEILNSTTQQPIPYANIGLRNHNVGTISNPDGSFSLYVPANLLSDTLVISSIGFGTKILSINYLLQRKNAAIYLNEKIVALSRVIVTSKKENLKTFELGNAGFNGGVLEADTLYAGRSVSLLINNKEENIKKDLYFLHSLKKQD